MLRRPGLALVVAVGVGVAIAGCTGSAQSAGPAPSPTAAAVPSLAPAAVTIEALGGDEPPLAFSPSAFEIDSGDIVRLVDVGVTLHDLTIDASGKVPLKTDGTILGSPSDRVKIEVDLVNTTAQAAIDLPPGTYEFHCSVHLGDGAGHANNGMVGTITVH